MSNKRDSSERELERAKRLPQLRQVVQVLTLFLFLYLLVGTRKEITTILPPDLFFRINPLLGITSILASQVLIVSMILGVFMIGLTVITGRSWCGWLCPLGTMLDFTSIFRIKTKIRIKSYWSLTKYVLLFIIIFTAIFGNLSTSPATLALMRGRI